MGESNGQVANDVTWPRKVKLWSQYMHRAQYLENSWSLETLFKNYSAVRQRVTVG